MEINILELFTSYAVMVPMTMVIIEKAKRLLNVKSAWAVVVSVVVSFAAIAVGYFAKLGFLSDVSLLEAGLYAVGLVVIDNLGYQVDFVKRAIRFIVDSFDKKK